MAQNYNDTIHKMQTPFEMRAGLPKKEPKMLEDWENNHVYEQMIKNNEGKPQYILHDGPPYANGNIHMGTALNKIIKDIIIRYKNMTGFEAPYVPGYDTHGLPIELKALSSLGDKKAGVSKLELRKICKEFATEHIDVMNSQFKRLGVQGDFENPYLTLRPEFEARQVEIFGEMAKKGYIYKGMKAVYWCPEDRTALAEAEIEYAEDECDSIYVRFKLTDDPNGVLAKHNIPLDKAWIVIWTTTTWTLPANVATCLNPNLEYAFVKIGDAYHIMAAGLVESTMKGCHIDEYEVLPETVLGSELELMQYQHPFLDRKGLVILGDHVTLEGGTGCTVILCPDGAVTGVDVRGGSPGTRDTDALNPVCNREVVHGVVLTGGSAFGLDAAGGVMKKLEEEGIGRDVMVTVVPALAAVGFTVTVPFSVSPMVIL